MQLRKGVITLEATMFVSSCPEPYAVVSSNGNDLHIELLLRLNRSVALLKALLVSGVLRKYIIEENRHCWIPPSNMVLGKLRISNLPWRFSNRLSLKSLITLSSGSSFSLIGYPWAIIVTTHLSSALLTCYCCLIRI